jgi:hypothetical protein
MQTAEAGNRKLRQLMLALALALATYVALASDARANYYPLQGTTPLASRSASGASEFAYVGPEVIATSSGGASTDGYDCPAGQAVTNYLAVVTHIGPEDPDDPVADQPWNSDLSYDVESDASVVAAGHTFHVTILVWAGPVVQRMHVLVTCGTDYNVFPYQHGEYGPYLDAWNAELQRVCDRSCSDQPSFPDYSVLVRTAFHWATMGEPANPASASTAVAASPRASRGRRGGGRFALHNGTNQIGMKFRKARNPRPPAIYLSRLANRHCRATQLQVPVISGSGTLSLQLQCHGLKRGAHARLTIRKAIQRSFHLHQGTGRLNIHLDKPPGKVSPFVYVSTHPAKAPCRAVHRKVRFRPRTLDLHLVARCERVPRKATGTLYVGGLLAANH